MLRFVFVKILEKLTFKGSTVAIGQHAGKIDLESRTLSKQEIEILRSLSPRKQAEWITSRDLLFSISDFATRPRCLYDELGKPYLEGVDKHISISHSYQWCAAMIGDQPCGVDVQVFSDTVRRIADRFLTPDDLLFVKHSGEALPYLHLLWGAKECLYKAYGKRKLGFREHIFISQINMKTGKAIGEIKYEDIHLFYDIKFKFFEDVAWVYCVERNDTSVTSA